MSKRNCNQFFSASHYRLMGLDTLGFHSTNDPEVYEAYAIEHFPTVVIFKKGKVHKHLDAELGVGLDKRQLKDLSEEE